MGILGYAGYCGARRWGWVGVGLGVGSHLSRYTRSSKCSHRSGCLGDLYSEHGSTRSDYRPDALNIPPLTQKRKSLRVTWRISACKMWVRFCVNAECSARLDDQSDQLSHVRSTIPKTATTMRAFYERRVSGPGVSPPPAHPHPPPPPRPQYPA